MNVGTKHRNAAQRRRYPDAHGWRRVRKSRSVRTGERRDAHRRARRLAETHLGDACAVPGCDCAGPFHIDHVVPFFYVERNAPRHPSHEYVLDLVRVNIDPRTRYQLLCMAHHAEKTESDMVLFYDWARSNAKWQNRPRQLAIPGIA